MFRILESLSMLMEYLLTVNILIIQARVDHRTVAFAGTDDNYCIVVTVTPCDIWVAIWS